MSSPASAGAWNRRPLLIMGAVVTALVSLAAVVVLSGPAHAVDRTTAMKSAATYGPTHHYKMGIAVYDTKLHKLYGSASYKSAFASESVVKAMIATRLIWQGRMHGSTAKRAYKMITQSDDGIASAFYGSVGGDGLINWIKRHYHVPDLGGPPHRAGWWGNTHITPVGLVKFYAKVKADRRVGRWLLNAMHHAHKYGSDGTYQFFGLPSATKGAAVKQGWGTDYDDWGRSADFNTTGFVNGDRYTVAILARGPARTYGRAIGNALTQTARRLLPGGRFPENNPLITYMSRRTGPTTGGQRVGLRGRDFSGATAVYFGPARGTALHRMGLHTVVITTPPHGPGRFSVRVRTDHGWSTPHSYYTFVRPPTVTGVSPASGPMGGGTAITVHGRDFTRLWSVYVGGRRATNVTVRSTTTLTAVTPPGTTPATVDVVLTGSYGHSAKNVHDKFTYAGPTPSPTQSTAGPSPGAGSATGDTSAGPSRPVEPVGAEPPSSSTQPTASP